MTMRSALPLVVALGSLMALGCTSTDGVTEAEAGAVVVVTPAPSVALYSPIDRAALAYGLPEAVAGTGLAASPAEIIEADEQDLAEDAVVHKLLVDRGLGPDAIRIEQREDSYEARPSVALAAIQLKGIPAEEFADFVPSTYLLATSTTTTQHNLAARKPALESRTIAEREVRFADWGDFGVAWYPLGDVVYVAMADTPERLAAAVRGLPWPSVEEQD